MNACGMLLEVSEINSKIQKDIPLLAYRESEIILELNFRRPYRTLYAATE